MGHHTDQISRRHYDVGLPTLTANVVRWLARTSGDQLIPEDPGEAVRKRRELRNKADKRAAMERAKDLLSKQRQKSNPAVRRTSQWNLTQTEREKIQMILRDTDNEEGCAALFQLDVADKVLPSDDDRDKDYQLKPRMFPTGKSISEI